MQRRRGMYTQISSDNERGRHARINADCIIVLHYIVVCLNTNDFNLNITYIHVVSQAQTSSFQESRIMISGE